MHDEVMDWLSRFAPEDPVRGLDIGGRDINGSVMGAFHPSSTWEVVDLLDGPLVTWVGSFLDYTTDDRFDVITCTEVAEHTPDWPEIVARAADMLDPGGAFILTAAGPGRPEHSAIDGSWGLHPGEHYENVDPDRLEEVIRSYFGVSIVDVHGTDVRAVGWKTNHDHKVTS